MVGFLSIHLLIVDRIPRLGESRRDGVTASVVVRQWLEGGHWGDLNSGGFTSISRLLSFSSDSTSLRPCRIEARTETADGGPWRQAVVTGVLLIPRPDRSWRPVSWLV